MHTKTLLKATVAAAATIAASNSLVSFAQQVDDEARLATVTTTAQRVEEDAQDVPISITTVSDEKLNVLKAAGADVRFLSARVPSVIAESSFGRAFPRFYIRGFGNTDFDLNATQPVSLVYDDIPYENPILKGYPAFDLQSVEVLRGPQGTLFGRNTPGGIIKFDSVKPSQDFDAYVKASYGTYDTAEFEGAIGGGLTENLSGRLSFIRQSRSDFVDNAFTGEEDAYEGFETTAFRGQLLWEQGDDFSALLNVHGLENEGSARLFRANIIDIGGGFSDDFDRNKVFYDGGAGNPLTQDSFGVNLRLEKGFGNGWDATYIYGNETTSTFSRGDIDGGFGAGFLGEGNFGPGDIIFFPSESSGGVDDLTQETHELRFAYDNGGALRGQTGVFLFDEEVDITSLSYDTLAPGQPVNGRATRSQTSESIGIFASLSYDLTEQLTVSGGLRFTDDEKDFVVERTLGPFGAPPLGPIADTVSDEQVSFDVSATYALNDDVNIYGRVAQGYRGPSVQGRLVFGDVVSEADSETVISYEAGVKSELLDNRVRLNTNVFFYEVSDQQLTVVGGIDNTVQLINADKGEAYGLEIDLEAAPIENLLVTAGLSYNKTEIKDDLLLSPGCGVPCTLLDPAVFDVAGETVQVSPGGMAPAGGTLLGYNISGNSFPNAPEWIGNVTARYSIPLDNGEFYAFTDWAYKGDTNFFLYESEEFRQDGYWEGGLRVGYLWDEGYDVAVFGRNITGEDALTGALDFTSFTGFINEPTIWGVEIRRDF
ncbi:MAG: TonB-dependent receptor [Pseudomonadota bacterium]